MLVEERREEIDGHHMEEKGGREELRERKISRREQTMMMIVRMCLCMYVFVYVYVCVCVLSCFRLQTHTHTHTHTQHPFLISASLDH